MKVSRLQTLWERLEDAYAHYALHFAGQPRLTRDLDILDNLIETTERTERELNADKKPPSGEREELIELARERLIVYREERAAIAAMQAQFGAAGRAAATVAARMHAVQHQYVRHFAGKDRYSRDMGLLNEMIADCRVLDKAMQDICRDQPDTFMTQERVLAAQYLEMFERERREVGQSRDSGTLQEQGYYLGAAANELMTSFETLVVGLNRMVCRPGLVERLVNELQDIRDRMASIEALGLHADFHLETLRSVDETLSAWREEHDNILRVRAGIKPDDMIEALVGLADYYLEEYNDQFAEVERGNLDLTALGDLCDCMDEVERQLTDIVSMHSDRESERNLQLIRDALAMLLNEYDALAKAPTAE